MKRLSVASGFSLMELMVAIALSALVVTAITGLTRQMIHRRAWIESQETQPQWELILSRQLTRDFELAESVKVYQGRIELTGHLGADFVTGQETMQAAKVEYFLQPIQGINWLLRRETDLNSLSNRNSRTSLVAHGIGQLLIEMELEEGATESRSSSNRLADNHFRYRPFTLYDQTGTLIFRHQVRMR